MNTRPDGATAPEHPRDVLPHDQRRARRPETTRVLRRSGSERVIAGVCAGIAGYVDASPGVVRAIFAISLVPSIGVTGLGYLVLWWLLPTDSA